VHQCASAGALNKTLPLPAQSDPLVGTQIGGRYQILAKLGHGGMGAVYEAVQDSIERRVAIKVLLPSVAQDAEISKRFDNEARAVNRVNHPGLVQVSDFGQLDSGAPYIVMEFLKGETLRQRMARFGGGLPTSEVIELGSQIAESLTAAHGMGIVHREPSAPSRNPV
jgi:serine/threonine-protein kinase